MSDYRVEKVRHRVALTLANGIPLSGDIFLGVAARFHDGPERPIDALNADDAFLAVVQPAGDVVLVQKSHVLTVTAKLPAEEQEVERSVAGMVVEFTLSDGSVWSGSIYPELRADRPRLVDFLNEPARRFIEVFTTTEVVAVSREHLAFARPGP